MTGSERPSNMVNPSVAKSLMLPLVALAIGVIAYICFSVGVKSPFLFDDLPNLSRLSELQGSQLFSQDFWAFVFSGMAGPTGRPVSLFTFALQAEHWPGNPAAFKSINVAIHLFNGFLLSLIIFVFAHLHDPKQRQQISLIGYFAVAIWLIHPIHTATIYLTVQRMVLLSSCFTLIVVLGHLSGRYFYEKGKDNTGLAIMVCSQGVFGLLAVLAKESGVLLLVYLAVLELTLLKHLRADGLFLWWRRLGIFLPIFLLVLYFIIFHESAVLNAYAIREFSLVERLMTEWRVLWIYVVDLLFPQFTKFGLISDVSTSTGLFNPITTVVSLLGWAVVVALALIRKTTMPVIGFCVFWYLGGHVLESSFVGLELFFYHRNYLPSLGVIVGLVASLVWLMGKLSDTRISYMVLATVLIFCLSMTYRIANLWTQPIRQAEVWLENAPESKRAKEFLASSYYQAGMRKEAVEIYKPMIGQYNNVMNPLFFWLLIACEKPSIKPPDLDLFKEQFKTINRFFYDNEVLEGIATLYLTGVCQNPSKQAYTDLLITALGVERFSAQHGILAFQVARLIASEGQVNAAAKYFDLAFQLTSDAGVLYVQGAFLKAQGFKSEALEKFKSAKAQLVAQSIVSEQKLQMLDMEIQALQQEPSYD